MTTQSPDESRPTLILYTVYFHKDEWTAANQLGLDLYDNLTRPTADPLAFGASIPVFCAVEPEKVDTDAAETVIVIPVLGKFSSGSDKNKKGAIAGIRAWHEKLGPSHVLPVFVAPVWRNSEGDLPGKAILTELYGEEPRRRSTITDIVVEIANLLADDGQRPSLFVSHAKADLASSKQAAEKIAAYARTNATAKAFFDRTDLYGGESLNEQIDFAVRRGVFVAVRGDLYSSRIWCQRELLGAKRHGLPTLTVETLNQGETRALAYGGNGPTLVWNKEQNDPGAIVSRAMIEWLRAIHFRREGKRISGEAGLPEVVILSRPPELLDMAQGLVRGGIPQLVMHPDPELASQELDVLRGANPRLHLVTPLTAYRRVLSQKSTAPGEAPLEGIQVAMSLSDSPDVDGPEGFKKHHIIDVTVQLARTLISSGAAIAYGGDFRQHDMNDPKKHGYTFLFTELIGEYNQTAARPAEFLHSYLAATIPKGDIPDDTPMTLHHMDDLEDVGKQAIMPAPGQKNTHPLPLYYSDMRRMMAKLTAAQIIIGGRGTPRLEAKGDGYGGLYPGVVEEAWLALKLGRPVYVVGGFGGAASLIAELLEGRAIPERLQNAKWSHSAYFMKVAKSIKNDPYFEKLKIPPSMEDLAKAIKSAGSKLLKSNTTSIAWNGLSQDQNKTLFWSRDPIVITSLVMRGLLNVTRKSTADKLAIELVHGSVTDARELDAIAVATFDDVPLGGAGKVLDSAVGGRAKVGRAQGQEIISVSESGIGADWIYLASLGQLQDTGSLNEKIRAAAVQTAHAARRNGLRRLGVVAYGGAVVSNVPAVAKSMLAGLKDLAGFASITWFETDEQRFEALRKSLGSEKKVKLTTRRMMVPVVAAAPQEQPLILQVSYSDPDLDVTVLPPAGTAVAASYTAKLSDVDLSRLAAGTGSDMRETPDMSTLTSRGHELAKLLLGKDAKKLLARLSEAKIVIVHDVAASRIPFETLSATVPAAVRAGMNRRLAVAGVPVEHLFARPPRPENFNVLLVINPTRDLPGAAEEGAAVEAVLKKTDRIKLNVLRETEATKAALLKAFPDTDVLHYCGHAFFDGPGETESGLILSGKNALTLADLRDVTTPRVAFVNACEAGRVRGKVTTEAASFAEFFLRSGVEAYLGTFWEVEDAAAQLFAVEVYTCLATGKTLDEAVTIARKKLFDEPLPDWANYILYGDGRFRLVKEGS